MPRPVRPWFRFYTEAFNDRKMLRLSPSQRWIWVAVLGAARESPVPGELMIAEDEPMTVDELARYAGVRVKDVTSVLPIMERLGMIARTERSIVVPNFSHRQYESDNVTARTRAHRERSKEQGGNVPRNVRGNTPETETETETETEQSSPRKRAALPFPEDFEPSDANVKYANEQGLDLEHELEQFKNNSLAKGNLFKDWHAAFRTWLGNSVKWGHKPSLKAVAGQKQWFE